MRLLKATLLSLACAAGLAQADQAGVLRPTELRSDKLPQAGVLRQLAAGAQLKVLSLEGGWAWVEDRGVRGWVRAGALKFAGVDPAARLPSSARESAPTSVSTLGVRSLPPRANRHALIITIGRYADASISPLPGAQLDRQSATQIAEAMQIPAANIRYLADEQATGDGIRKAIAELGERVLEGDRVYVHFSGHGTRFLDRQGKGCTEALLAHDGGWTGMLTSREMADLLSPMARRSDKMFLMYDACYSGGVLGAGLRTRSLQHPSDEGALRPRFSISDDECSRPVNVRSTRNLLVEATDAGVLPTDIVHLSSSRDNEISFDDEQKGGLATQFVRDCMLREAVDADGSGAISIDEVRACAQDKLNKRLENDARFKPSTLTLTGNSGFVPTWFGTTGLAAVTSGPTAAAPPGVATAAPVAALPVSLPPPAPTATAPASIAAPVPPAPSPAPVSAPAEPVQLGQAAPAAPAGPVPVAAPAAPVPVAAPAAPEPVVAPPPLTGEQALRQLFAQRDAKRRVSVKASAERLKIRKDILEFSVRSDRPGYVYVAIAASDNKSLQLLFPNDLDQDNAIVPGKPLTLPRPNWRVRAGGPAGTNNLLVMVTDARRDLAALAADRDGPFLKSLNNTEGRAQLGALMTRARIDATVDCSGSNRIRNPRACSDAFGAAMFTVEEVQ